jgi:hypothetical protein
MERLLCSASVKDKLFFAASTGDDGGDVNGVEVFELAGEDVADMVNVILCKCKILYDGTMYGRLEPTQI